MVQSERKSYSNLQNQGGKTKLSISINTIQYNAMQCNAIL